MGQTVAGNLVVEKIADGPLGSLYQAEQVAMKRTVALRVLNRGPEVTEGVLEGVLDNVRAVGKLSHSNIIVVYDAGEKHNLFYISMAYVEGESVRDILLKHKRLVPPDALYIMSHAIRGLRHAWRHGMVHGDVRPSNILVSKHGTSKLTDFGALPDDMLDRMRPARRLAYLRYASPERLAGEGLDITSDIYSLGATLYHMICGQPPFVAESIEDLQDLILHGEIPPPSSVREDIPTELDEVILKMMAKGRHERPETPSDLLKALKRVASAVGQPANMG